MKTQIKTIETYLPVFPGFYNTYFDMESEIDSYLYDENVNLDQVDIDYRQIKIDISQECCNFLENELNNFVKGINYQNLQSPRFYNFSNDSINIEIVDPNIEKIKKYIYENKEEFTKFLKDRYTSRDGFRSFYSNEFKDWKEYTSNFKDYNENEHYLGAILEFICENEGITLDYMYNYVRERIYIGAYIRIERINVEYATKEQLYRLYNENELQILEENSYNYFAIEVIEAKQRASNSGIGNYIELLPKKSIIDALKSIEIFEVEM